MRRSVLRRFITKHIVCAHLQADPLGPVALSIIPSSAETPTLWSQYASRAGAETAHSNLRFTALSSSLASETVSNLFKRCFRHRVQPLSQLALQSTGLPRIQHELHRAVKPKEKCCSVCGVTKPAIEFNNHARYEKPSLP